MTRRGLIIAACASLIVIVAWARGRLLAIRSVSEIEAIEFMSSVSAAQESYRADNSTYINLSSTVDSLYPSSNPEEAKKGWDNPRHPDYERWKAVVGSLENKQSGFGYVVLAKDGSTALPAIPWCKDLPPWPQPTEPRYIVAAKGRGSDGCTICFARSSLRGDGLHLGRAE